MSNTNPLFGRHLWVITFIISSIFIYGQDSTLYLPVEDEPELIDQRIYFGEIGALVILPRNAFSRNIDHNLYGIYLGGMAQLLKSKPLFVGLGIGFAGIGSFDSKVNRQFDTGQIEQWDSGTSSRMVAFQVFGRYFIDIGSPDITPFAEMHLGRNFFYTSTNLSFPGGDETSSSFDKSDFVGYYGGGAGLSIAVADQIYLSGKILYLLGQSGSYYIKTRNQLDNAFSGTIDAFDLKKSATNMVQLQIGISYSF